MENKKPNIILIFADQLRFDCIGFAKKYSVKTPNIDKLASRGVWFENSFSVIPLCVPARQSLVCGKRPERFGGLWNYDISLPVLQLPKEEFSYARALKAQNYETHYVGKWHVNENCSPLDFGFDSYYSEFDYRAFLKSNNIEETGLKSGSEAYKSMFGGKSSLPLELSATHFLTNKAIDVLEKCRHSENPFHLVLSLWEPHLPCMPSEEFAEMYSKNEIEKWGAFDDAFENKPYIQKQMVKNWGFDKLGWEEFSQTAANYYGIISQLDDAVGKFLDKIDELGLGKNSVIIFTTDHGDMSGNHHMMDKHYVMYDDVVRVPFTICWDGHFTPRVSSDFNHNLLDLHATMLDIAGATPDKITDGTSLLPQLLGKDCGRDFAISTYNGQQYGLYTQRMIRTKDFKYIWNLTDIDEFYDLNKDKNELHNGIYDEKYKNEIAKLRVKLFEELKKTGDAFASYYTMSQLLQGNIL